MSLVKPDLEVPSLDALRALVGEDWGDVAVVRRLEQVTSPQSSPTSARNASSDGTSRSGFTNDIRKFCLIPTPIANEKGAPCGDASRTLTVDRPPAQ